MAYKIFMTIDAAEELKKIIQYLIEKREIRRLRQVY